jgi:hypothetical protein
MPTVKKFRRKHDGKVFIATQWLENEDHPNVRPYDEDYRSDERCGYCGAMINAHGLINNSPRQSYTVHPGNWVFTSDDRDPYVLGTDDIDLWYNEVKMTSWPYFSIKYDPVTWK